MIGDLAGYSLMRIAGRWLWALLLALSLFGCGAARPSEDDQIATRVAVERAVAQTLTAEVVGAARATEAPAGATAAPNVEPTPTPALISSPAPSAAPLEPTAPPPSLTPVPTAPPPSFTPVPTARREVLAVVVPGGFSGGVTGEVRLRGGIDDSTAATPVVRDTLAMRAVVSDPEIGPDDGAGVISVAFSVSDPQGNVVYEITEINPAYCLSGGNDPSCELIDISPSGSWPDGAPVSYGIHQINMQITATSSSSDGSERGAFWFIFVDLQPPLL